MPHESYHTDHSEGTSQPQRAQPALLPDSFRLDERGPDAWIAVACGLAKRLKYCDFAGRDGGDWRAFLEYDNAVPIADIQAFLADPECFVRDPRKQSWLTRPHFALFLAFLELLDLQQQEINRFTQRHLDYFYRQVLGIRPKPAEPDRVHVLFEPARGLTEQRIEAGALLLAGKTPAGKPRYVRTEAEIVVNRAKVSAVKVFFQERAYRELPDVYKAYLTEHPGRFDEAVMHLIYFVMPENQPLTSRFAPANYSFTHTFNSANPVADIEFLAGNAKTVLEFAELELGISLHELRRLMALKQRQENPANPDWATINRILEATRKPKDPGFSLPGPFDDFSGNFEAAIGFAPLPENTVGHPLFSRVQNVNNLIDFYELLADAPGIYTYLEQAAAQPLPKKDFVELMEAFGRIGADWRAINRYLKKIKPTLENTITNWPDWPQRHAPAAANFQTRLAAVRPLAGYPILSGAVHESLDPLWADITALEQFFNLPAEELLFICRLWALDRLPDEVYALAMAYLYPIRTPETTPEENIRIGLLLDDAAIPSGKTLAARRELLALVETAFRDGKIQQEGRDYIAAHLPLVAECTPADFSRLLSLLEKADYSKVVAQRAEVFEPKFRLKSNPEFATHNRFKLLEHHFGSLHPVEKYFVLPPYPPTNTTDQDTAPVLYALHQDWNGDQPAAKAQARTYLETAFSLPVKDFDRFLAFFQPVLPPGSDWDALYRLLAEALLRRETPVDRRPRQVDHLGFFAAPDATLLHTHRPGESHTRWRTFGRLEQERDTAFDTPPVRDAELGLVIESPLLEMAATSRTITVEITGHLAGAPDLAGKFGFYISSNKEKTGFFKIIPIRISGSNPLTLILTMGSEDPPATTPVDPVFGRIANAPVLKMVWTGLAPEYKAVAAWSIQNISLKVDVEGLVPETAWNDEGTVNPEKPFEPFGSHPRTGSRFAFAHPDMHNKNLENLTMHFEWMGKPNGKMADYYSSYWNKFPDTSYVNPFPFNQQISLSTNTWEIPKVIVSNGKIGEQQNLMSDNPLDSSTNITVGSLPSMLTNITLELLGDFGHDQYLARIQELTIDTSTTPNIVTRPKLNIPYTPRLKSFSLDYTTKVQPLDKTGVEPHRVWQLHPFGVAVPAPGKALFLTPPLPYEAELYIGLENVAPLQSVSILFQVAEGSANLEMERRPVEWQYLGRAGWRTEDENSKQPLLTSDPSDGFTRSAVLRFQLPGDAVDNHPLLPGGYYWLRAVIAEHRQSVCDLIGIHAQAVSAVRVLDEVSADDPGLGLPPQTVAGLLERRSGIKAVAQPYGSFGGRSAEKDDTFYGRVSERLRHKQRALSAWDVEHLLLEQFPDLYRVKCLPVDRQPHNPGMSPGQVDVIVLPNLRGRLPQDPLQPRLPVAELDRMSAWLQEHGPQAARYRVRNARFLPLQVEASLRLHPGYDAEYYLRQLADELTRYLSPWAFDDNADIRFGGTVYVGQLLNFIEERPYVDFIAGLRLHWEDTAGTRHTTTDAAVAPQPDVVWVSAEKHNLQLAESFMPARKRRGIGEVAVAIDFLV